MLVSVIELMLNGMGIGWTYVLLAGLLLLTLPAVYLSIRIGPKYRVKRQRRREEAEKAREEAQTRDSEAGEGQKA